MDEVEHRVDAEAPSRVHWQIHRLGRRAWGRKYLVRQVAVIGPRGQRRWTTTEDLGVRSRRSYAMRPLRSNAPSVPDGTPDEEPARPGADGRGGRATGQASWPVDNDAAADRV